MRKKSADPEVIIGAMRQSHPPIVLVALTDRNIETLVAGRTILLTPEDTGVGVAVIVSYGGASPETARAQLARLMPTRNGRR